MSSSSRGGYFTASPGDSVVRTWAAEANRLAPTVLSPRALHYLIMRPAEGSGTGIFVRDGCTVPHESTLAGYWGHLTHHPNPGSHHALELPPIPSAGGFPPLCVDAHHQCLRGSPLPTHAGLANHACEDPSCSPYLLHLPDCAIPIVVLKPRRSLRGGTELTYNYDAHRRSGAYTVSAETAGLLAARGRPCRPCRCAGLSPCPRERFFL